MQLSVSGLFSGSNGEKRNKVNTMKIWKQTSTAVWLMFKGKLLDSGVELIISMSKEVIFLFKVCITLDLQYC